MVSLWLSYVIFEISRFNFVDGGNGFFSSKIPGIKCQIICSMYIHPIFHSSVFSPSVAIFLEAQSNSKDIISLKDRRGGRVPLMGWNCHFSNEGYHAVCHLIGFSSSFWTWGFGEVFYCLKSETDGVFCWG